MPRKHLPARGALAAVAAALGIATVGLAVPASAASTRPEGKITRTVQARDGSVLVTGWAYDADHSSRSIAVCVARGQRCIKTVTAGSADAALDRSHHVSGRHGVSVRVGKQPFGVTLELRVATGSHLWLSSATVQTPGQRIVALARTYVGHARYVEGGASPSRGFDCSGFTQYVFKTAQVAGLPHNAEAQRHVAHMRRISRASARPGDLIFYLSGRTAYHVAIYAGNGKQYAAATPQDGIRYQAVWSSDVQFATDWH